MYLQLSQSEATAGTDTAVVLDGRASHDRSELVDGTGRDGGGLSLASNASRGLLAGLYSTKKFTCQTQSVKKAQSSLSLLTRRNVFLPPSSSFKTHHRWLGGVSIRERTWSKWH